MHAALEETGQDAARFKWMARNVEEAEGIMDDAARCSESDSDVLPLLREGIDVARSAEEARSAQGKGSKT